MTHERVSASELVTQIKSFIAENYPYEEKNVDWVINDASFISPSEVSRANYLRCRANDIARTDGIIKITDEDYPGYHVPTLIAAVKQMEEGWPEEEKRMTLPQELKILAVAEFTNARNLVMEGRLGIALHEVKKAQELSRFFDELKRTPEFDFAFHPARKIV